MKKIIIPFFVILLLNCSTAKEREHSISEKNLLYSNYENSKGITIHKNIKVQKKVADTLFDLEEFRKKDLSRYDLLIERSRIFVKENLEHLKLDGWKYISAKSVLVLSLTAALMIPIPGTFEVLTTTGFIVLGVQRLRETKIDKIKRIELSILLDECSEANDNLKDLQKNALPNFYLQWKKYFSDKTNHVKNMSDHSDIRIYDRDWNTYRAEKEYLIQKIEIELDHADNQCSYLSMEEKVKDMPKELTPKKAKIPVKK